jgi:hypothetical protein
VKGILWEPLERKLQGLKVVKDRKGSVNLRNMDVRGDGAKATAFFPSWGWQDIALTVATAKHRLNAPVKDTVRPFSRPFRVTGSDGSRWVVTPKLSGLLYSTKYNWTEHQFGDLAGFEALATKLAPETLARLPGIDVLRKRAEELRIDVSDIKRSKTEVAERIRRATQASGRNYFKGLNWTITFDLDIAPAGRSASADWVAHQYRTAGGQTFEDLVWIPDVKRAFREAVDEAERMWGHQEGYSGHINMKHDYKVVEREPMTVQEAYDYADRYMDRTDKWGPAHAVPVCRGEVVGKGKVTVTVRARSQRDAERKGRQMIEATGRIPPRATPIVEDLKVKQLTRTGRVNDWEATGLRKVVILGTTDGWLFYGWASS